MYSDRVVSLVSCTCCRVHEILPFLLCFSKFRHDKLRAPPDTPFEKAQVRNVIRKTLRDDHVHTDSSGYSDHSSHSAPCARRSSIEPNSCLFLMGDYSVLSCRRSSCCAVCIARSTCGCRFCCRCCLAGCCAL